MQLTPDQAAAFQRQKTYQEGVLVVWSITTNTKDFGAKYVARPIVVPALRPEQNDGYLLAESLQEIRRFLPTGLTRLDRNPQDDPVIVEIWF